VQEANGSCRYEEICFTFLQLEMIQYDLSAKRSRNLSVLQKIDARVLEIISEAAHTCIYKFNAATTQWERYGVEGAAFIVRNCQAPFYSFIVMNKMGIDDFILDLSTVQKAKVQDSYIMLRCSTNVRYQYYPVRTVSLASAFFDKLILVEYSNHPNAHRYHEPRKGRTHDLGGLDTGRSCERRTLTRIHEVNVMSALNDRTDELLSQLLLLRLL
jgi:Dcp1-like decapping family